MLVALHIILSMCLKIEVMQVKKVFEKSTLAVINDTRKYVRQRKCFACGCDRFTQFCFWESENVKFILELCSFSC